MIKSKLMLTILVGFVLMVAGCKDDNVELDTAQFRVTIENTGTVYDALKSGAFTTPVGASNPAPIGPGGAYEFEFTAPEGARLSFATMFVQSNDWIYATSEDGLALYNSDGSKVTGDVTSEIDLYDAGTEIDQEPGTGEDQAPRQSGPDTGADDPDPNVRLVNDNNAPANSDVIQVTLTSTSTYGFRVRVENVSTSTTLQTSEGGKPVPLSPGFFAVHSASQSRLLFEVGSPGYGEGMESLAEDGDPSQLLSTWEPRTGVTTPLAPGAFAVFSQENSNPMFTSGNPAPGNGLEAMAEDGDPSMLAAALSGNQTVKESGAFNTPDGASNPAPIFPGESYSFSFTASEGDLLTFATMYVQSNDLFYAPAQTSMPLFENGTPATGTFVDEIVLWDAGTEANQEPGVGGDQAPRQSGPDTGPADSDNSVRLVDDGYTYEKVIRVTLEIDLQ